MELTYKLNGHFISSYYNLKTALNDNFHTHIIYVNSHFFSFTYNEKDFTLSQGEALLLPPFTSISYKANEENADLYVLSYFLEKDSFSLYEVLTPNILKPQDKLTQKIKEYSTLPKSEILCDLLLKKGTEYEILSLAEKEMSEYVKSYPNKMLPLLTYIENNFSLNFQIQEMAKDIGLSESGIYKLFEDTLKISPKQYIKMRRMNYALHLLLNTEKSILDISIESGFYDQYYFSKEFKKEFSVSPSAYRKAKKLDK